MTDLFSTGGTVDKYQIGIYYWLNQNMVLLHAKKVCQMDFFKILILEPFVSYHHSIPTWAKGCHFFKVERIILVLNLNNRISASDTVALT